MVDHSAGKNLSAARLSRGLSIDEAAHATKMRPDKILALENDDYARFGSATYAKSFLLMYARFLAVDVSEQSHELGLVDNRVHVEDYQYLSNAPAPEPQTRHPVRRHENRKPPSILPLLFFFAILAVAGFGFWIFKGMERLDMVTPNVAPPITETAPKATPEPPPVVAAPEPAPIEKPAAEPETAPVIPAVAQAGNVNEVIVEPLRQAWVKIRRDTPDSPPIFEGDLYPQAPPLKLRGARFFVEVRDQSSVQIRKNGLPIAYQAPGISIQ